MVSTAVVLITEKKKNPASLNINSAWSLLY